MGRRKQNSGKRRLSSRPPRSPLIGYFAAREMMSICEGDALIITGTQKLMEQIIRKYGLQPSDFQIRSTTFSEIMNGIAYGGAYCFDEQAYQVFLPLACSDGLSLQPQDFTDPGPLGIHLVRVQVK